MGGFLDFVCRSTRVYEAQLRASPFSYTPDLCPFWWILSTIDFVQASQNSWLMRLYLFAIHLRRIILSLIASLFQFGFTTFGIGQALFAILRGKSSKPDVRSIYQSLEGYSTFTLPAPIPSSLLGIQCLTPKIHLPTLHDEYGKISESSFTYF